MPLGQKSRRYELEPLLVEFQDEIARQIRDEAKASGMYEEMAARADVIPCEALRNAVKKQLREIANDEKLHFSTLRAIQEKLAEGR